MAYYEPSTTSILHNNITRSTPRQHGNPHDLTLNDLFTFQDDQHRDELSSEFAIPSNVQLEIDSNISPSFSSQSNMNLLSSELSQSSPTQSCRSTRLNSMILETPSSNSHPYSIPSYPSEGELDVEPKSPPQELSHDIISALPTPRALKAKRRPTNKCSCGGKRSCTNQLCAQSVGCFSCPVCGIEFSRKNSMRRHVLTHINLRPYECTDCKKSFYRSDIYKRHLISKRCRRNTSQAQLNDICKSTLNYSQ